MHPASTLLLASAALMGDAPAFIAPRPAEPSFSGFSSSRPGGPKRTKADKSKRKSQQAARKRNRR